VGSGRDPAEKYVETTPHPGLIVETLGSDGGRYRVPPDDWVSFPTAPLPGPVVCTYGAGDTFAAGLTFALGAGKPADEAVRLAAELGAKTLTIHGPYEVDERR